MNRSLLLLVLAVSGCSGTAGEVDAGAPFPDAGPFDAGPQPLKYTQYTRRADGWPAGAHVLGAAVLDNVLFVASDQGVLSLAATETRWVEVTTPLTGDLKPTSLQRVDQSLVMTAAGATTGGLYVKAFDGAWAAVAAAPAKPAWQLVKKSATWLLATTGGLYAAADLQGPWTRRSAVGTTLFTQPTTRLVAAPAQQKLFATGTTAALNGLFESADLGITWVASTPRGQVDALTANGAIVLVSTATDGQQRSDNYGNTFRPGTAPITSGVLTYVAQGTRLWAGGNGGLHSSDDDGATFTANAGGLPSGTAVRALFFAGSYALVDTADGPWLTQVE